MNEKFQAILEEISSSGPDWLKERRIKAFNEFQNLPLQLAHDSPLLKNYTQLKDFNFDNYAPEAGKDLKIKIIGKERAKAAGITIMGMSEALEENDELLKEYLLTKCILPEENKFIAFNAALWQNGILIHAGKDSVLEEPIELQYLDADPEFSHLSHTLIVGEEGSKFNLIHEFEGMHNKSNQNFNSNLTEIILHPNSKLNYLHYQNWNPDTFVYSMNRAVLEKDSNMIFNSALFGGNKVIESFEGVLIGKGANCTQQGVFLGNNQQHFDVSGNVIHQVPHTKARVEHRGVMKGKSNSIFRGLLRVEKDSHDTESYVGGHALLLSEDAKANSVPSLRIDNNDVRTKHASTVTQVDSEQLFYLMSRGMEKEKAEQMIVKGYFEPVLESIKADELKEKAQSLIDERIQND